MRWSLVLSAVVWRARAFEAAVLPDGEVFAFEHSLLQRTRFSNVAKRFKNLVMVSTNDVYKLMGKPSSLKAWVFEGSLSTSEGEDFLESCYEDSEGCFPASAVGFLGIDSIDIEDIRFNDAQSGERRPILSIDSLGCMKSLDVLRANGTKFGNMMDYGKLVQFRKRSLEANEPSALFLNIIPGDFLSPSYEASLWKGMHMLSLMNDLEVDVVTFGNHDFDHKNKCTDFDKLCVQERMNQSNFLWLGANVHPQGTDARPGIQAALLGEHDDVPDIIHYDVGNLRRTARRNSAVFANSPSGTTSARNKLYWSVEVDNLRVCFFGSTQRKDAIASASTSVMFTDALNANLRVLKMLESVNCSFVVALTHQRTGEDIVLWSKAIQAGLKPPDLILGGHDHYAAFLHLTHPDDPRRVTRIWKMGADAQLLVEVRLSRVGEDLLPSFNLLPVVEAACRGDAHEPKHQDSFCAKLPAWQSCPQWSSQYSETYAEVAASTFELASQKSSVFYNGLFNTASVREHESRAANTLLDLHRIATGADAIFIEGGNIRGDALEPKVGEPLTALDIKQEFPFSNKAVGIEMSLLQLFGVINAAVHERIKGGISPHRMHISGVSVSFDMYGAISLVYEGPCHVGGLLNRSSVLVAAGILPCNTTLWSSKDGFGSLDPWMKFIVGSTDFAVFEMGPDVLRRSGDLALTETLCSICGSSAGADFGCGANSSVPSNYVGMVRCESGRPEKMYYKALAMASSFHCGIHNHSSLQCWEDVGGGSPTQPWSMVRRFVTHLGNFPGGKKWQPWKRLFKHGLIGTNVTGTNIKVADELSGILFQTAKAAAWRVGSETKEQLLAAGVNEDDFALVPREELLVERFRDMSRASLQRGLAAVLQSVATLMRPKVNLLGCSQKTHRSKVRDVLNRTIDSGVHNLNTTRKSSIDHLVAASIAELYHALSDDSRGENEAIHRLALKTCRLALWQALGSGPHSDGRLLSQDCDMVRSQSLAFLVQSKFSCVE